jgi:hypothetical protein
MSATTAARAGGAPLEMAFSTDSLISDSPNSSSSGTERIFLRISAARVIFSGGVSYVMVMLKTRRIPDLRS